MFSSKVSILSAIIYSFVRAQANAHTCTSIQFYSNLGSYQLTCEIYTKFIYARKQASDEDSTKKLPRFHFSTSVTSTRTIWFDYPLIYNFIESVQDPFHSRSFHRARQPSIIYEFLSANRWVRSFLCDYWSINTSMDWTCVIGCENGFGAMAAKTDRSYATLKL